MNTYVIMLDKVLERETTKDAADKEQAVQIAETDPFVKEGVRTYSVRTWLLANEENNYLG